MLLQGCLRLRSLSILIGQAAEGHSMEMMKACPRRRRRPSDMSEEGINSRCILNRFIENRKPAIAFGFIFVVHMLLEKPFTRNHMEKLTTIARSHSMIKQSLKIGHRTLASP
uniref:Secreted protein n=1 Tax=Steinernema glaseri TaxID=37863 RepID=A0A1I8A8E1_9BILA